jgi:hypothetical protein
MRSVIVARSMTRRRHPPGPRRGRQPRSGAPALRPHRDGRRIKGAARRAQPLQALPVIVGAAFLLGALIMATQAHRPLRRLVSGNWDPPPIGGRRIRRNLWCAAALTIPLIQPCWVPGSFSASEADRQPARISVPPALSQPAEPEGEIPSAQQQIDPFAHSHDLEYECRTREHGHPSDCGPQRWSSWLSSSPPAGPTPRRHRRALHRRPPRRPASNRPASSHQTFRHPASHHRTTRRRVLRRRQAPHRSIPEPLKVSCRRGGRPR